MSDSPDQIETAFRNLMMLREGCRTTVYSDSRGLPTVGIGHLVVPADNLQLDDVISMDRVNALFASDSGGGRFPRPGRRPDRLGSAAPTSSPISPRSISSWALTGRRHSPTPGR
jgi:hypothetical protein